MITQELRDAFRYHRQQSEGSFYAALRKPVSAASALQRARLDVANGKARSPAERIYPAVSWDSDKPGLAHVHKPRHAGLRLVARVVPETNRRDIWDSGSDTGWHTDPYGDVFKDGTGLCFGVVFQLPGRHGKARFVAGYQFGGTGSGPTINLSDIHEEDCRNGDSYNIDPKDVQAARDAARRADDMAKAAAEIEREYQTAWQAGSLYAGAMEEIEDNRKSVLETIRAMKGACATLRALPDILRNRLASSIRADLASRSKAFERAAVLARGDHPTLGFYPSDELRAAFNDGAGRTII